MKRKIKFTKKYANKKKDDVFECDAALASNIVNSGVATYVKSSRGDGDAKTPPPV